MMFRHKNSPDRSRGLSRHTETEASTTRLQSFNAVIRHWFRAKGRQPEATYSPMTSR